MSPSHEDTTPNGSLRNVGSWTKLDSSFLTEERRVPWERLCRTSVHRALRWGLEVLGNATEVEDSVRWCLQQQYHPPSVVRSEVELARYVLLDEAMYVDRANGLAGLDCLDYVYYERFMRTRHHDSLGAVILGRQQAEQLIRATNHAISMLSTRQSDDVQGVWTLALESCRLLWLEREREIYDNDEYAAQREFACPVFLLYI